MSTATQLGGAALTSDLPPALAPGFSWTPPHSCSPENVSAEPKVCPRCASWPRALPWGRLHQGKGRGAGARCSSRRPVLTKRQQPARSPDGRNFPNHLTLYFFILMSGARTLETLLPWPRGEAPEPPQRAPPLHPPAIPHPGEARAREAEAALGVALPRGLLLGRRCCRINHTTPLPLQVPWATPVSTPGWEGFPVLTRTWQVTRWDTSACTKPCVHGPPYLVPRQSPIPTLCPQGRGS